MISVYSWEGHTIVKLGKAFQDYSSADLIALAWINFYLHCFQVLIYDAWIDIVASIQPKKYN
jgi:hypothetical protein